VTLDEKAHISTAHLLLPIIEKIDANKGEDSDIKFGENPMKIGKAKQLTFILGLK
jgi:hypothetical protein